MKRGFTLIEVLVVLLVLSLGLTAMIGVMGMAIRSARTALARYTANETAWSSLYQLCPLGSTADPADADGDGWRGTGSFSWTGSYTLSSSGTISGYFVTREETSGPSDVVTGQRRWALVTVEAFDGLGGASITQLKERILREGVQ